MVYRGLMNTETALNSAAADAVAALDALPGDDPDVEHHRADHILLAVVPDEVSAAYRRLQDRCGWWATA
jgi:hypothetical protein